MNHILLLEDIPEIRAWLKALVKQVFANAQITECSRVQDALSLVNGQRFTLALLDLGLPDGSGVEVIAALREKQPEVQSVIVTTTSICSRRCRPAPSATCSRSSRASCWSSSCNA
jgi:DNA-binding response OmpR family regulator